MKSHIHIGAVFLAIVSTVAGCGGGSNSVESLEGKWTGTVESPSGALSKLTAEFTGNGRFTVTSPDGSASGTAKQEQPGIFSYKLDDGTIGGFMVDADGKHAGFVDEEFYFGVLQKDASNLPSYSPADVMGTWSGTTVELAGSALRIERVSSSSVNVASSGSFSGSNADGSFTGSFYDYNSAFGRFRADASQRGSSYYVAVFLTADKSVAAGYGCAHGGSFPDDCGFVIWHR
jgi:hypothetical protein